MKTEKRNLEYLQLLESIEVILMNGNSIKPNSVIRGAIQVAIGKEVNKMKQTAVGELLEYFVKQQKEGCSNWCIHDLIAQLYVAKAMEKEQIVKAYESLEHRHGENYYNQTFKSE